MVKNIILSLFFVLCMIGAPLVAGYEENVSVGKMQIEITSKVRTITAVSYEFDPYSGDYVDAYHFLLDNKKWWIFDWGIYERNKLSLQEMDEVCVIKINETFFMLIPNEECDPIMIKFEKHDDGNFYAGR